ncbi:hypothetical protein F5884DRAFT_757484 [Xylogone sp. PMI_703]|nr:hypothetical protein F5884DRAFT_757484 [Xylogone sp. PMI_703]
MISVSNTDESKQERADYDLVFHTMSNFQTPNDGLERREKTEGITIPENISDREDIEPGQTVQHESINSSNIVTWNGPNDPENPINWLYRKKWAAMIVMSSFTFISPVLSTMTVPALAVIGKDFNITNTVEKQAILSIFILAYTVRLLFLALLSELYGQVIVLQLANLVFLMFNLACGLS